MSRTRFSSYMVFTGMLLLFASTVLSQSFVSEWKKLNGPFSLGKLSATVNLAADPTGSSGLSLDEAERLSDVWGVPIAYSARVPGNITTESRSVSGDFIGIGGSYDQFTHLWLRKGVTVSAGAIRDHARVAVLSSDMADQLFHSQDVVGLHFRMMNTDFHIVGVFTERDSLVGWMTDDGVPDLLIPVTTMIELQPTVKIQTVNFQAKSSAAVSGEMEAGSALTAVGKQASAFVITNYVQSYKWVAQKPALLLFMCGLIVIWLFIRIMASKLKAAYRLLRQDRELMEVADIWTTISRTLMMHLAGAVLAAAGILLMWLLIRYPFYIPADSIPGELIDWTFYRDKMLEFWQNRLGQMGYVASSDEILQNRVNTFVTWLLGAGFAIGLPLFIIGAREWAIMNVTVSGRLIRICLYMLPATALTLASAWWAGIPTFAGWKETTVLFGMFAVYAVAYRSGNVSY
ncbi:ABC transporter permease [Cohnella silvisoli]|uniref:ABC transporter permease n=1 Tax=Cohnella silvisoli TaxID=2873699 RepID=A0ABV1L0Y2_9BACL|nr:ABC transporter permease [Cohnella silvisoli]MCD9025263.1 ABC transporter permease [Cohnella silvisoli]